MAARAMLELMRNVFPATSTFDMHGVQYSFILENSLVHLDDTNNQVRMVRCSAITM